MTLPGGPTAGGERSTAVDANSGVLATGDGTRIEQRTLVLPPDALKPALTEDTLAGLHNLPHLDSAVFEGRNDALKALADLPSTGTGIVAQSVKGMGGVGKSTLVLRHARQHVASGRGPVWWIPAESPEEVTAGLAELAVALNPVHVAMPLDEAAGWAVSWLQGRSDWLVVLDNVEDPTPLQPLLGRLSTGQVLISTRRDLRNRGIGTVLTLDTLHPQASLTVLRDLTGRHTDADTRHLQDLANELGHLPLGLQQAGAYLAQTRTSPYDYLVRLREDPATTLATTPPGDPHQRTIARLWSVTLTTLQNTDPNAVPLLQTLAYLAPTPLPRNVLDTALPARQDVDQALGLLAAYSMITLTDTTVTIHRLLQAVLRATAPPASPLEKPRRLTFWWRSKPRPLPHTSGVAVAVLLRAAQREDPHEVESWPYWQELLPHILAIADSHLTPSPGDELAQLLGTTGSFLRSRGQARQALPLEQRALMITEAALGPDHPSTAIRLGNLAGTLSDLGRRAEALPLEERALVITEAALGPDHPSTALRLGNLARTLGELGRYEEALPLDQRALVITEAALGPDHPDTATSLGNLARTLSDLGRYEESLPLEERALVITEAALGPDHPTTAIALGNLATTLGELGRRAEALPLEERALVITEAALGPDHPTTALRLGNLARTLGELGRYEEALPLEERALVITEAALGPDHPSTAIRLGNLAGTLSDLGRYEEALPLKRRALMITEAALGPDHPSTAIRLGNLAATFHELGWYEEALPLEERALVITEAVLGPDHPSTTIRLGNLARTLGELGRYEEALPLKRRALVITEAVLGPDHPSTAIRLGNLARTLSDLGRYEEALPLDQRALVITEAVLGPDHPSTAIRLGNLARTLSDLGRYEEALPLDQRALVITEAALGPDHPDTATSLGNLARTLSDLGRYEEALPLEERALVITEATLGPDHPDTALRLGNLARLQGAIADDEEAS
ncbi:tetratricopeptide repeat protein [Streptomyces niveus]|uniref:tetratricopeptide repeat protein n=3 Tax=Streptomyces niveus TaxID=193462 RepID=UPI0034353696